VEFIVELKPDGVERRRIDAVFVVAVVSNDGIRRRSADNAEFGILGERRRAREKGCGETEHENRFLHGVSSNSPNK
jgi:hypothetical protein